MSFIDEKSVASLEKSDIHISLRSKVREKRKLRQRQNWSKSFKRKLEQQPVSSLLNKADLKTTTNELTQKCKGDDTSSDYENDEDIDKSTDDSSKNDQLEGSSMSTMIYHPYTCIFCKKGFMDRDRLNTCFKNCRLIRLNRPARLIPERQEWYNQYETEGSTKDQCSLTPPESHQYEFSSEERQRQQLVHNISASSSIQHYQSLSSSGDITHSNGNMDDPLEDSNTEKLNHASSNLSKDAGTTRGLYRNFMEHQRRLCIRENLQVLKKCIPGLVRRNCSQEKILIHAVNYCELLNSIKVKFKKELEKEEQRNTILKKKLEHLMRQLDKFKSGDAEKIHPAIRYVDISINGSSKQHRRAAEKKCLEKLRGFSNALNNISQRPQQQQLQLTLLDKRRQTSHQTVLQHQGPTQVQRHHLMTIPSTITLTPSSANTPSNRVRQPVSVHGGNLKSGRLGGVVFNRRDSISLPPSPTHSMLIKKETLVSSGNGEPIVIQQPIALPQVPLALHQSIIQQQPRQYIHIKTEPNLTAAASNIPAQLNSTNISTANTCSSNISTSASNTKVSPEGKNVILKTSGLPVGANAQKEVDLSAIDQCDNSNTSPSSISPNSITGNSKRKGCLCGISTMPGKLTCCGQRCPCYVDAKACFECKCKGCRNPHRPNGEKSFHPTATESSSSKTSKKAEKRSVVLSSSSTLDNQTTVPTKLYIKSGSSAGTQAMVKRVHLGK